MWEELTRENAAQFFCPGCLNIFHGYDFMLYCHEIDFYLLVVALKNR